NTGDRAPGYRIDQSKAVVIASAAQLPCQVDQVGRVQVVAGARRNVLVHRRPVLAWSLDVRGQAAASARGFQVVVVRGDHHHVRGRDVEDLAHAEVGLAVGL